jgi:hypothetical protein
MVMALIKKVLRKKKVEFKPGDHVKIKSLGSQWTIDRIYYDRISHKQMALLHEHNHKMRIEIKDLERVR